MCVVKRHAVFTGMEVVVDGNEIENEHFIPEGMYSTHYPELGARIAVCPRCKAKGSERGFSSPYTPSGAVNFHGQVVNFHCDPVTVRGLVYLVDLTGEPTGIRMMLPARTKVVENEAFKLLLEAIEVEAFRYISRQPEHSLSYKEYLRGKELGFDLPEAKPEFEVGLIFPGENQPEPTWVQMPSGFPIDRCYRAGRDLTERDETNAHLLAALGGFAQPFVPVHILPRYDGYSWADLPRITKVSVKSGQTVLARHVWDALLVCVKSLNITVRTSDGKTYSAPVCMAEGRRRKYRKRSNGYWRYVGTTMLVTCECHVHCSDSEIWYHLGGYDSDDGDGYETQERCFSEQMESFWSHLVGPEEDTRRRIIDSLTRVSSKWNSISAHSDGTVEIRWADGSMKTIQPPPSESQIAAVL